MPNLQSFLVTVDGKFKADTEYQDYQILLIHQDRYVFIYA